MKTLKDLSSFKEKVEVESFIIDKDQFIRGSELKEEVIKWIIKDIKDWNAPGGLFQSEIIQRWKERFNITEDDLK